MAPWLRAIIAVCSRLASEVERDRPRCSTARRWLHGCGVSPDGKWVYFTADPGRVKHIWRQRFPDGQPVQITSGPTEEEVIAMAPDGRSFVTAVALQNTSLWIHDPKASVRFPSKETTK